MEIVTDKMIETYNDTGIQQQTGSGLGHLGHSAVTHNNPKEVPSGR